MSKPKKAFTLIELLVVIAIIGVLATVSIIALSNARSKSRDAKRVGNMKQVQTALELFFNDNGRYPTEEEWAFGSLFATSSSATTTYLQVIPTAPTPADGDCSENENALAYTQVESGASYSISFCIGNTTGTIAPGNKTLTPAGIIAVGGEEEEETPPEEFVCGDTLTDSRDSQTYATVNIDGQCWMAENLNIGDMVLGSVNQADNSVFEKHCYDNDAANCLIYGGIYQWDEAMQYSSTEGAQGICPTGWHVPARADFFALAVYLIGQSCDNSLDGCPPAGDSLKEVGTSHWNSPNTGATNSSGFTALGGGSSYGGSFYNFKNFGVFWSSLFSGGPMNWHVEADNSNFIEGESMTITGVSVRCLQDPI
ncbi:MAG: FISUMP domain-containing protein [Patescibacteria group bacterium]